MAKFIGANNDGIIKFIADSYVESPTHIIVKLPPELEQIDRNTLLYQYRIIDRKIIDITGKKNAKELKVAFITNHNMACGIALYGNHLFPEIIKHVGDFKIFTEIHNEPTGDPLQLGELKLSEDKIIPCWIRGQSLMDLVIAIKEYNPSVIIINHEWGLFPNARFFLSMLTQLSHYRIITILHSVFPHHQDKSLVESALHEIIVHLEGAKQALIDKGINAAISVIPHGCSLPQKKEKLWNIYKSEHTIVQIGFLFPYKNYPAALKTVALLKDKFPDIFFTAVLSQSPFAKLEHRENYEKLLKLIQEYQIENNVALITGYQSDQVIDSFYRTNAIAIFPYTTTHENHLVWGSSGASRSALAYEIPVLTSSIPHFSDLPTIKVNSPELMAQEIEKLFLHPELKKQQIQHQNEFLEENSWEKIAQKFIEVIENPLSLT